MRTKRTAAIVILLLLACACNGGAPFIPLGGPFSGQFSAATQAVGAFTLTYADGMLGGTGSLLHNGQALTLAVSAVVSGSGISGQLTNAAVGSGTFTGQFTKTDRAYGDFEFTDTATQSKTAGTWIMATAP